MQNLRRSISQWRTARHVVLSSIVLAGALASSVWLLARPLCHERARVHATAIHLGRNHTVTYSGIGVAIRQSEEGSVFVERVFPGTPADGVLMPGMRIVEVDGKPIEGDLRDWTEAVRGEPGTDVELTVGYHCGGRQRVRLTRRVIRIQL